MEQANTLTGAYVTELLQFSDNFSKAITFLSDQEFYYF